MCGFDEVCGKDMAEKTPTKEELIKNACAFYKKQFNDNPSHAGSAPGRVNIIGEHTDYNNGFVFPMALPLVTVVVGKLNNSSNINLYSMTEGLHEPDNTTFKIPKEGKLSPGSPKWANYCKGVIANFKGNVPGFNAVIISSVPIGGGVSSSASLEVATYTFLEALTGTFSDPTEKALACQKAEHDFANMPCGIMDQYASVFSKEKAILLLDCGVSKGCQTSGDGIKSTVSLSSTATPSSTIRSLEVKPVDYTDSNIVFLVTNSNVKHKLSGSEYPSRRKQCQDAAAGLRVDTLREADMNMLEDHKSEMDPIVYKRARHVVSEISRTLEAVEALIAKKYQAFGYLMLMSHVSLKYDYEVTCPELDELVDIAMKTKGVYGSRMTGGGFGGCTVTLVESSAVNDLISNIKQNYKGNPVFYIATPAGGAADETSSMKEILRKMQEEKKYA